MKRYIKIYLLLIKINLSNLIIHRANLINSFVATVGWSVISIVGIMLLTNRVTSVYGWTKYELYLLAGIYTIIIGINHMLFSQNFRRFSEILNKGSLDGILLKPIDSQFQLSLWQINFTSILRSVIGIIFTIYAIQTGNFTYTFLGILVFTLFIGLGTLLLYSIWYIIMTCVVWFTNLTNLVDFLYNFNNLARYPKEIITKSGNIFLLILFPLTLVATVPVREFLQKVDFFEITYFSFFSLGLFVFSRVFWKYALRYYGSASG